MKSYWLVVVVAASFALVACGGSDEPDCPTADCSIPGSTVVKWRFNEYPEWNFLADTCIDVDSFNVRVEAIGVEDPTQYFSVEKGCGDGQATLLRMPEGTYDIAVTPLDGAGNPLVTAPARGQVAAGLPGTPTETIVNVPYTAWAQQYTGTFLFNLKWAGQTCETAAVITQTLELVVKGQPAAALADNGQKLDGTDPKPCRSEQFAQFAEGLPFGPATIKITGKDTGGTTTYTKQFDTFVGVGKNNPTITFDVPLGI